MKNAVPVANRILGLVRGRNRELALDAGLKAFLGIAFSLVTFGMLFGLGWFAGFFFADSLGLAAWQFAAILTGVFFIVAAASAWLRVAPLANVKPLTDRQLMLTLVSQASGDLLYFSPRHAVAGMAVILIGGPANLFEAIGTWSLRLPRGRLLLEDAARLLDECEEAFPVEEIPNPPAALLLKRLALIKIVPLEESVALLITQKGFSVLGERKKSKKKRRSGD